MNNKQRRRGLAKLIHYGFYARRAWLGMYQSRAAGDLGWMNDVVFLREFERQIEIGGLIEIVAATPNDFPVYLPFDLCGSNFEPYPATCALAVTTVEALQCMIGKN